METPTVPLVYQRRIQSFVRREGRMTKIQAHALETLWPIYGLSVKTEGQGLIDFDDIFKRTGEKILEIGFGDGHSLVQMAKDAPNKDFIGIEVYRSGVGNLLATIQKEGLSNIRVFCADALEVLEHAIPDHYLAAVQLFFADPWPKSRHHKRRLVQTSFGKLIARKLKVGGTLHMATDWTPYAHHMMSVLGEMAEFENIAGSGQFVPRPDFRPLTKYEKRGLRLGHPSWDLIFRYLGLY